MELAFPPHADPALAEAFASALLPALALFPPDALRRAIPVSVQEVAGRWAWRAGDEGGTAPSLSSSVPGAAGAIGRYVAEQSETYCFIHGAVVALGGAAVVLPGRSGAGKSTAAEAAVSLGATYYSDEFAPVDARGFVHAFPRPVNRRTANGVERVDLGGGGPPLRVDRVVLARYVPGATWRPRRLTKGESLLELTQHIPSARRRPARMLDHLAPLIDHAEVWAGERGEARVFAEALLADL